MSVQDCITELITASEEAVTSAEEAQLSEWEAQASKMTAQSLASQPVGENVIIYTSNGDGTFSEATTTLYSALHWGESMPYSGGYSGMPEVNNIASLALVDTSTTTTVYVKGYYIGGDGGGGTYIYNASLSGINNGGTIVNGWVLQSDLITLDQFGCVGNGTTDDYQRIMNAINFAKESEVGEVRASAKIYAYDGDITLEDCGIKIVGMGAIKDNYSIIDGSFIKARGTVFRALSAGSRIRIATLPTSSQKTTACGLERIAQNGNGIATNCLVMENTDRNTIKECVFEGATDIQVSMKAMDFTMPTGAKDVQNNTFDTNLIYAGGTSRGLVLDSEGISAGNASINTFINTYIRHADNDAIQLLNADSNTFISTRCTRLLEQTGRALLFGEGDGTPTGNKYARTNIFYNFHSSQGIVEALGDTTYFPSKDNAIFGFNLDGGSAIQDILIGTNATLTVQNARQHNMVNQNSVSVANENWQNFNATPFRSTQALAKFKELGFYPSNIYGSSGNVQKYYDLVNDAEYKINANASGLKYVVPSSIPAPAMDLTGWDIKGKSLTLQGNQVVSARKTGWAVYSGAQLKTISDPTTISITDLAKVVGALIYDLRAHGLIGS